MTIRGKEIVIPTIVWYLGILIPLFTWLATLPPPATWDWSQWMGNCAIALSLIFAKLSPGSGSSGNASLTKIAPLALLAVLLFPSIGYAQGLRASIPATVHAYVAERAQDSGTADAIVTDKAVAVAEVAFISSQALHVAYAAVMQAQSDESVSQTILVGVSSTASTLALIRFLPARWEKFAALIAVGVATAIVDGRKIVQQIQATGK